MKKVLLSAALLFAMTASYAATPIKHEANKTNVLKSYTVKHLSSIKVVVDKNSCTATASVGVGANKIQISATAATCKEAIAMVKAAIA